MAKRAGGGPAFVWLYGTHLGAVAFAAGCCFVLHSAAPQTPFIGMSFTFASAILHAGYFVVLQEAYREGELSVVYPVARGTGPVLSTLAAIICWVSVLPRWLSSGRCSSRVSVFALAKPARSSAVDTKRAITLRIDHRAF